jgi:hypothetical protein
VTTVSAAGQTGLETVLERQGEMEAGAQGGEVAADEGGCAWRRGGGGR